MQTAVGTDTLVWVVQRAPLKTRGFSEPPWELMAIAATWAKAIDIAHENDRPYQFNRSQMPEHTGVDAWVGWSQATQCWLCIMAMAVR